MTTKTDGGPAFPFAGEYTTYTDEFGKEHRRSFRRDGMTLRDAMALSVKMPDEYSTQWAEILIGEKAPMPVGGKSAPIDQHIDFWMRAEAAYRYRLADALLAERNKS